MKETNNKNKYIGIMKFDNGTAIPATVEAKDRADALLKIAKYCTAEGYFPISVEVIALFDRIGIIEI